MAAYLIYGRHEIRDPAKSARYAREVVPTIVQYGGQIVAARGAVRALEGEWNPAMVTMLRFESMDRLMAWYHSPEYAPLKELRLESDRGDMLAVEGV